MAIPLIYTMRNLRARKLTTIFTLAGMGLVVFVFAAILMLAEGLQKALVETGSFDNVVVLRKGSNSEVMSGIDRGQASILETLPEIAIGPDGQRLLAKEIVVLIALRKIGSTTPSNVVTRGIGEYSLLLRPQVKLIEGRLPRFGTPEVMVGASIARRFEGVGINEKLCCSLRNWTVVGIFDAGSTAFSSEIWGDAEQLIQAFRRPAFSSVLFKLRDSSQFGRVQSAVENDPRLTLEAKQETRYYAEQSEMMARFLRILGLSLTSIFSLGAMIGAMITMYSAVANRTAEIGILRALGFQRRGILAAFLLESLLFGFLGGCLGLFLASFMQLITISTLNFQSFSELAFSFAMTFEIVYKGMAFSLGMGFIGGILPAFRAARLNIVTALRAG